MSAPFWRSIRRTAVDGNGLLANVLPEVVSIELALTMGQTTDLGKMKELMPTPIAGKVEFVAGRGDNISCKGESI
jgi:hypothetical protein